MIDLNQPGAKVLGGNGGGTSSSDPFIQATADAAVEAAVGTSADGAWNGSGAATAIAALKAIVLALGAPSTPTDGSGTVTAGGTAQTLFDGATPAKGFLVQNNSSAALWVNDIGTAAAGGASLQLLPGAYFQTPVGYLPGGPVSIFGADGGQAFAARRW